MFVGYSGRDVSIMEALTSVLQRRAPFPNGLYWVTSSPSRLLPAVVQFLKSARLAGVDVAVVEPLRVFRRLQLLSRMEHHEQDNEQVFP